MKYIRTKANIYEVESEFLDNEGKWVGYNIVENDMAIILITQVINHAETIEELCDFAILKFKHAKIPYIERLIWNNRKVIEVKQLYEYYSNNRGNQLEWLKLGILTDKGIIYVAKMNENGELVLI